MASEEYFDLHCGPCSERDRMTKPVTFCVECGYMCSGCLENHNKFRRMREHKMFDQQTMEAQGSLEALSVPTERCEEHHGRMLDTYCSQHNQVCCETCVSLKHRNCVRVEYLPNVSKGVSSTEEFKQLVAALISLRSEMEQVKQKRMDDAEQLKRDRQKVKDDVAKVKHEIINRLKILEENTLAKLDNNFKDTQLRIDANVKMLDDSIRALERSIEKVDTSRVKNETKLFTCMKSSMKELDTFEKTLSDLEASIQGESLRIAVDLTIKDFAKKDKTFGELRDIPLHQTKVQTPTDVRTSSNDSQCGITNMCQLDGGTILIVDSQNKKLIRLDSKYKVCESLRLPGKPVMVCCTGPDEVALTLVELNQIQFVTVGATMSLSGQFPVNSTCRGIACVGDRLFVSCGGGFRDGEDPGHVRVYSRAGQLLSRTETSPANDKIFSMPLGVTVSRYNSQVYVADRDNGLVTLNRQGGYVSTRKDQSLSNVTAVCVGSRNELFVCGIGSRRIIQYGKNGSPADAFTLDSKIDIRDPQALLFDRVENNLLVAGHGTVNLVAIQFQ